MNETVQVESAQPLIGLNGEDLSANINHFTQAAIDANKSTAQFFKEGGISQLGLARRMWGGLRARQLNPEDLSDILKSISIQLPRADMSSGGKKKLYSHVKRHFFIWEDAAIDCMDDFSLKDLKKSLAACARLGIEPSETFMNAWQIQLIAHAEDIKFRDYAECLWSLAALHVQSGAPRFQELYNFMTKSPTILRALEKPYGYINHTSRRQIRDTMVYFGDNIEIDFERRGKIAGIFEGSLRSFFRHAGFQTVKFKDSPIPALNQAIDFGVIVPDEAAGSGMIMVEHDGVTHFINPPGTRPDEEPELAGDSLIYNGNTKMRSAISARCAPDNIILRVPYLSFMQLKPLSRQKQTEKLQSAIKQMQEKGPGCYRLLSDGNVVDMLPERVKTHLKETRPAKRPGISSASGQAPHPLIDEYENGTLLAPQLALGLILAANQAKGPTVG